MKHEKNEVFEIRDYLIVNNYPQGLINILDDYFTNKAITLEEVQEMMTQDNFAKLVDNYQIRGAKRELTFREAMQCKNSI
ncbi:hypothetical protein [Streptococcus pseudoporcinus]|uniref:Uncharacterized protein n=1 Tax=Streptococcus pseudoporcinus LQ 940-04 TaxID=875093 RepID=G5K860_9STRE|nr:hypothetical protein [Streptococcus pseudoporcinus]QBX10469.1 hypothetical protein JavanS441_0009 [Streptococcus satellite phage Javan441]QBX10488.1 hypothetical protein JavanS442_0009 [Streptococcus satellite phage Javan442]EFR44864.1 hypothetical protein HMPREF9320_0981 [Streptococcus pseudoporcinus SPIN 20026]EHI64565.1 hypothetical protein STRPS_1133 [Streptococcus pseudoporcinus LQ 940-04]VEF94007.1 Uncharacterised protein [Streptococcus pseudoporcinus]